MSGLVAEIEGWIDAEEIDPSAVTELAERIALEADGLPAEEVQEIAQAFEVLTQRLARHVAALREQVKHAAANRQRARGFGWARAQTSSQRVSKKA